MKGPLSRRSDDSSEAGSVFGTILKIAIRLCLVAVLLVAAFKWDGFRDFVMNAKEETRKYVLDLVQKPEDKQVMESLPAVPPPNVYYTLQRIEFPNPPYGFKAFEIGMPVRKVGEGGGKYIIEAGKDRTTVDPVFLTREPKEIARVMKLAPNSHDGSQQDHIRFEIEKLNDKIAALKTEKIKAETQETEERKFRRGYTGISPLFIQNEIDRYVNKKHDLEASLKSLPPLVQANVPGPVPSRP